MAVTITTPEFSSPERRTLVLVLAAVAGIGSALLAFQAEPTPEITMAIWRLLVAVIVVSTLRLCVRRTTSTVAQAATSVADV